MTDPRIDPPVLDEASVWIRLATRVRQRLQSGSLARAVVTLVAGTAAAQLIVVITAPILTRIYVPAELGAYSAALAILSIHADARVPELRQRRAAAG